MITSASITKAALRRHIRGLRKQLSVQQQSEAAIDLADKISARIGQLGGTPTAHKVALFVSMDGEVDTRISIERLWQQQVEVYLPLIHPFNSQQLVFIRYHKHTELLRSPLGMLEPRPHCANLCPIAQLDILFIPLVAFDDQRQRLGMGGGFYDRTLGFHYQQKRSKPQIIGLAHDCQKVDSVPVDPWDLSLDEIITPTKHYR